MKAMAYERDGGNNYIWPGLDGPRRFGKVTGKFGNRRSKRVFPNYSIAGIGQNTEKSAGDLRRLSITHTSVKNQQLILLGKTRTVIIIIIIIVVVVVIISNLQSHR